MEMLYDMKFLCPLISTYISIVKPHQLGFFLSVGIKYFLMNFLMIKYFLGDAISMRAFGVLAMIHS